MHALLRRREITARLGTRLLLHRRDACIERGSTACKLIPFLALHRSELRHRGNSGAFRLFVSGRGSLRWGRRRLWRLLLHRSLLRRFFRYDVLLIRRH